MSLGLALSGGGSRAAAFHRGTLKGLQEVGLLDGVEVASTVSGGSLFGAAWVVAKNNNTGLDAFLAIMANELEKGFVARALASWNILKLPLPGYDRTDLFADAFDKIFFNGMKLEALPDRPALCLNTTVLNTGQVGKFTKTGFQTSGRYKHYKKPLPLQHVPQLASFPVARAVAASAAFPIGLNPVNLRRGKELPQGWGEGTEVEQLDSLQLTDGGVLENMGVQTILDTPGLRCWDLIVSDAGTAEGLWRPTLWDRVQSGLMGAISSEILKAVSVLMNNKNDRHTRFDTVAALEASWMAASIAPPRPWPMPGIEEMLEDEVLRKHIAPSPPRRRKLLMPRVDQNWEDLLSSMPRWRLVELGAAPDDARKWTDTKDAGAVEKFLTSRRINLAPAKAIYDNDLKGRQGVDTCNAVSTNFTALKQEEITALYHHARWQVHLLKEIYW